MRLFTAFLLLMKIYDYTLLKISDFLANNK